MYPRRGMATITLTPSRVDLQPGPSYSAKSTCNKITLQPSAMPPPPPSSVSPRKMARDLENPFLMKRALPTAADDVFTAPSTSTKRAALGPLNANHNLNSPRPPIPNFHTAIPKPPLIPDVFTITHKRSAAEDGGQVQRKRRALNDVRIQDQRAAARESEQEKWRSKWIKSFPTLTFHFDVGAQEGPGRLLKARTTKMGAVSLARLG